MRFFLISLLVISCWSIEPKIFVFGDSHSKEFSDIPNISIHYLGPMTMHRIGRDQLDVLNLSSHGIDKESIVIFAFGEIDVRCHIGKQRDLMNRNLDEVILTLVANYLEAILKIRYLYNNPLCVVYGVTPPTDIVNNSEYPRYGLLEDRIAITKKLNDLLQSQCKIYGIEFLDVYADFSDEQGALIKELSDDNVHINNVFNAPIRNYIEKLIR